MPTLSKRKSPFKADQTVVALRTFAWAGGTVRQGEKYRGGDPTVIANFTAFVDGETLPSELENPFSVLGEPPQHAPPVAVQTIQIPAHRQVHSLVEVSAPMRWSPDSPGARSARSGVPPPFASTTLRQGQIVDALHSIVKEHPSWFRWPARDVSIADIERLERLEHEGGEHGS
jgi:hypothetical protein